MHGKNIKDLAKNITDSIHKIQGIQKTVTCIVVNGK
jgi:phenylpyruvate tautomerase PptA (4-oxalocrotonate tautomerase family)